ncbi:MAG: hypothetical protein K2K20_02725 [Lachnospiraceae bacterium]|nr:hypothetical protein [Lachnospiraceae bacterium]
MILLRKKGNNKQLNELLNRIQMNFENNYKDAAQMNLKEYEDALKELEECGKVKGSGRQYYEDKLNDYKEQMKKFTHKDQKPKW